jgi:hypothetical protein
MSVTNARCRTSVFSAMEKIGRHETYDKAIEGIQNQLRD